MLFRKKKLIQNVHRVEDLQVGDLIQYDIYSCARVLRSLELNKSYFDVQLERLAFDRTPAEIVSETLHRDLKIFVWR